MVLIQLHYKFIKNLRKKEEIWVYIFVKIQFKAYFCKSEGQLMICKIMRIDPKAPSTKIC